VSIDEGPFSIKASAIHLTASPFETIEGLTRIDGGLFEIDDEPIEIDAEPIEIDEEPIEIDAGLVEIASTTVLRPVLLIVFSSASRLLVSFRTLAPSREAGTHRHLAVVRRDLRDPAARPDARPLRRRPAGGQGCTMGRTEEARSLFERAAATGNDLGLLAEEYDPKLRRQLGNFPQAFSHFTLVNAALRLGGGDPSFARASR
jgi:hypothetical protein